MRNKEIIKELEKQAEDAQTFSDALWEQGDKTNAHAQSGRSIGLLQAIKIIKEVNHD